MEKEINIKVTDCIDYLYKVIDMTKKNELIWENINTLVENYDLSGLINESSNGVMKYKTKYGEIEIILSSTYYKSGKIFNFEFFPNGDLAFYRMPNISINDTSISKYLEELEQFIKRQIKKRDTEKIAKIMGID